MPFVVEDGTGVTGATSYSTVARADAYFADRGNPTSWTGLSTTDKETALMEGTDYLDNEYAECFKGVKVAKGQALSWPRTGAYDEDYYTIDNNVIPERLQDATAEAALRSVTVTAGLMPDIDEPGRVTLERKKVSSLEKETRWEQGGRSATATFQIIDKILAPLLSSGGTATRA